MEMRLGEVTCYFFKKSKLDKEQVRVGLLSPNCYSVYAGRQLTEEEIKGAIVRYVLQHQKALPTPKNV